MTHHLVNTDKNENISFFFTKPPAANPSFAWGYTKPMLVKPFQNELPKHTIFQKQCYKSEVYFLNTYVCSHIQLPTYMYVHGRQVPTYYVHMYSKTRLQRHSAGQQKVSLYRECRFVRFSAYNDTFHKSVVISGILYFYCLNLRIKC